MQDSKENTRKSYTDADCEKALSLRLQGATYKEISNQMGIAVPTLQKWFSPSCDRHGLATLKDEQVNEIRLQTRRMLEASVAAVANKLIDTALQGDVRAMIYLVDRVYGKPKEVAQEEPLQKIKLEWVTIDGRKAPEATSEDNKESL